MSLMARRAGLMGSKKSGKEIVLLASGVYVKTDEATNSNYVEIPVSFSGTPLQIMVVAQSYVPDVAQTYQWLRSYPVDAEIASVYGLDAAYFLSCYKSATGVRTNQASITNASRTGWIGIENGAIKAYKRDSTYVVRDNTYNWYIWGYKE